VPPTLRLSVSPCRPNSEPGRSSTPATCDRPIYRAVHHALGNSAGPGNATALSLVLGYEFRADPGDRDLVRPCGLPDSLGRLRRERPAAVPSRALSQRGGHRGLTGLAAIVLAVGSTLVNDAPCRIPGKARRLRGAGSRLQPSGGRSSLPRELPGGRRRLTATASCVSAYGFGGASQRRRPGGERYSS
jgi:hypothetical protein